MRLSPEEEVQTEQNPSTQTNSNITPVVTVSITVCSNQTDRVDADVTFNFV